MLKELVHPRSVAVLGVTEDPRSVGRSMVSNLVKGGFAGLVVPVGSAVEVEGVRGYRELAEHGGEMDLGIVALPADQCLTGAKACVEAGVKVLIVVSPGFRESGEPGAALEKELLALCRRHEVRLLGPNSLGVLNVRTGFNATSAIVLPPAGGVGIFAQSGALCLAMVEWCAGRKVGVSKVVGLGNKADLNEVDLLRWFEEDEETRVVVGCLESIEEGARFLQAAEQCAMRKPVVLLKVGVTRAGARAAASHTGSLAGADVAYAAAFQHAGVLRAETLEQLFDDALGLGMQPLPEGNRVVVLTNAGGAGILAADAAELAGFELVRPGGETAARLQACVPASSAPGNPVDLGGEAEPARWVEAVRALQDDPGTDAIVVVAASRGLTRSMELAEALGGVQGGRKPVLMSFLGGREMGLAGDRLMQSGFPCYPSPERAMRVLRAMREHAAWRKRPARVVVHFPANRRRVDRILRKYERMGRRQVSEVEAKEVLEAYGFKVLPSALAMDVEGAVDVAEQLGYPVVMKVVSPDIVHKSDIGGVVVNVASAEQVRDGWDLILARARRNAPSAQVRGVYVEKMGRRGREVILGFTRDAQFGAMLMFGLGGIFVEVLKDVAFQLAPITADEALQMLKLTRSYGVLEGARGQKPVDMEAIAGALQRISQLATDYPQIEELDINPFIVGEVGTEAYAADARITLGAGQPGKGAL